MSRIKMNFLLHPMLSIAYNDLLLGHIVITSEVYYSIADEGSCNPPLLS